MTIDIKSIEQKYMSRYGFLKSISDSIQAHLTLTVSEVPRIDTVRARAKSPDRFLSKASKLDEDGNAKYVDPLSEIQDQIGARITVFYLSDVDVIKNKIEQYFRYIEIQNKTPNSESEFGYFGVHFILKIPDDVISDEIDKDEIPEFFELQIKTLFQHAWSEAHHDLGYKTVRTLTSEEKRKVAFTAAQSWGADTIFEELSRKIVNDNDPENGEKVST